MKPLLNNSTEPDSVALETVVSMWDKPNDVGDRIKSI